MPDSSSTNNRSPLGLIRSSSFESIHITADEHESPNVILNNDKERKRQAKLRSRACNDSFRQAVDKSYCQNLNLNEDGKIIYGSMNDRIIRSCVCLCEIQKERIHVESYLRKCLYGTGILIKLTEIFEKLISAAGNV